MRRRRAFIYRPIIQVGAVDESATVTVGRDLGIPWTVRTLAASDAALPWTVRVSAARDLALPWTVRVAAGCDLATPWTTRNLAVRDLVTPWTVRALAARDLAAPWTVRVPAGKSTDLPWTVRTLAARDLAAPWTVKALAGKSIDLPWTVRTLAARELVVPWNITYALAQFTENFSGAFPGTKWGSGSTATLVGGRLRFTANQFAQSAIDYDPRGSEITAKFDASGLTDAATYMRIFTTPGQTNDYVTVFVEKDIVAGYRLRMLEAVGDVTTGGETIVAFDESQPVYVRIRNIVAGDQWEWSWRQAGDWTVARTAAAATPTPALVKPFFRATSNQTGEVFLDDVNLVTGPVGRDLALPWTIRVAAGRDLAAPWTVRALAGRDLAAPWMVRALAGRDLALPWTVRALAGRSVILPWDVQATVVVTPRRKFRGPRNTAVMRASTW